MYCPVQGTGVHLCAGMVAGAAASIVTNPIDTVKVRLQTKIADKGGAWMTFRYPPPPPPRFPPRSSLPQLDYTPECAFGVVIAPLLTANSSSTCPRRMISNEGLSSLTKGLAPRLTMTVPISAVSGVCYELVMTLSRN